MKRILQCVHQMNRGGLETFIMNVYRNIDRTKYQFDFFVSEKSKGDYDEEITQLGGKIYYHSGRRNGYFSYIQRIYCFFRIHKSEYVAVHAHVSSLSSIEVLMIATLFKIQSIVIHSHSTSQKGSKIHLILHRLNKIWLSFFVTDFLACSDLAQKWLYSGTRGLSKSVIIPNGINLSHFRYNECVRFEYREKFNLSNAIVLGHVGRFDKFKNQFFLIDIFVSFLVLEPNAYLVLIGTGELQKVMEVKVGKLGITNRVLFLGLRSDIAELLQMMDAFVFPSLYEGLPVSLVEAQAAGLPVFMSDTISTQSVLTGNVFIKSLSESANEWALSIKNQLRSFKRKDVSEEIREQGYDIATSVNYLINNVYE